jgi:5,10-methylenetetrahydromethanopterin reductase
VIRALLDEGALDFAGDFFRYKGVTTAARPVQEHVPVKLGAMGGPKSMRLAGEVADGLNTACAYSAEAPRYAVHQFDLGAASAGRDADRLDIGDSLLGAIAPDPNVARRAGRILAAFYLPPCPPPCSNGTGSIPARSRPSTKRSLRATYWLSGSYAPWD